jgi:hypothetical protein
MFRREIVDELLQDPSYSDVTYRLDYGASGHDIDSLLARGTKINIDLTLGHVSLEFSEKPCLPRTLDCEHRVGCLRFRSRHRCNLGHEHAASVDVL